jgi:hypothetical protein
VKLLIGRYCDVAPTLTVAKMWNALASIAFEGQHDVSQTCSCRQINKSVTFHPGLMDNHTLVRLLSDRSVPAVATIYGVRGSAMKWF